VLSNEQTESEVVGDYLCVALGERKRDQEKGDRERGGWKQMRALGKRGWLGWVQWYTPVISAAQEAKIG
jgi:hypothetical protein